MGVVGDGGVGVGDGVACVGGGDTACVDNVVRVSRGVRSWRGSRSWRAGCSCGDGGDV